MAFPDWFSDVPPIMLHDPLAEVLGAAAGGLIEYRFADAVRLAGHSCPTVAGAWLAGVHGLAALYGEATPVRGDIDVCLGDAEDEGVAGVIGAVLGLLTGAAGDGGFKGLGGHFRRNRRLHFGEPGVAWLRLRRRDTGAAVDCRLDLSSVPGDPRAGTLLGAILGSTATPEQRRLFGELWQDRVRRILLETDPQQVLDIRPEV